MEEKKFQNLSNETRDYGSTHRTPNAHAAAARAFSERAAVPVGSTIIFAALDARKELMLPQAVTRFAAASPAGRRVSDHVHERPCRLRRARLSVARALDVGGPPAKITSNRLASKKSAM